MFDEISLLAFTAGGWRFDIAGRMNRNLIAEDVKIWSGFLWFPWLGY